MHTPTHESHPTPNQTMLFQFHFFPSHHNPLLSFHSIPFDIIGTIFFPLSKRRRTTRRERCMYLLYNSFDKEVSPFFQFFFFLYMRRSPLHALKPSPTTMSPCPHDLSIRLGNNRFGQPGAWQVSLFRDTIAPRSGLGGGAGGYANSAIGTASSAPVFSTASPAGTPRCVRFCGDGQCAGGGGRGLERKI